MKKNEPSFSRRLLDSLAQYLQPCERRGNVIAAAVLSSSGEHLSFGAVYDSLKLKEISPSKSEEALPNRTKISP